MFELTSWEFSGVMIDLINGWRWKTDDWMRPECFWLADNQGVTFDLAVVVEDCETLSIDGTPWFKANKVLSPSTSFFNLSYSCEIEAKVLIILFIYQILHVSTFMQQW